MCKNAELYLIKLRNIHQYFSQGLQFVKEKRFRKTRKLKVIKLLRINVGQR